LVDASVEPTDNIFKGGTKGGICDKLERIHKSGDNCDISKGDLVSDKIGFVTKVVVEDVKGTCKVSLGLRGGRGIGRKITKNRVEPNGGGKFNVMRTEINP